MPGNFYSEPLKDEVKRLRAELSRERALVATLHDALFNLWSIVIASRFQPDEGRPGMVRDGMWDRCLKQTRSALSELEKSK